MLQAAGLKKQTPRRTPFTRRNSVLQLPHRTVEIEIGAVAEDRE